MKPITLLPLAAALLASVLAGAAHAADVGKSNHSLTRQEVRADLEAWQRAGLAEAWRGDATPDIYSNAYQKRFANYERLRAAPAAAAR